MSGKNRRPYLTATVLNQNLLDDCLDNLDIDINMIAEIEAPPGWTSDKIRVSDKNIFVGGNFFIARTNFETIARTIGEWLSPEIEFSKLELLLSNVDGFYNRLLPSGDLFKSWINKQLTIKVGLRDVESSYFPIFQGFVTPVGGFKRDTKVVKFLARDRFDQIECTFPTQVFKIETFPKMADGDIGKCLPFILGDFTEEVPQQGSVITFVVNSRDPKADGREQSVAISLGDPGLIYAADHFFDDGDEVKFSTDGTLPTPLNTEDSFYVRVVDSSNFNIALAPDGDPIALTGENSGNHDISAVQRCDLRAVIAGNDLQLFHADDVWLMRGDFYYQIDPSDVSTDASWWSGHPVNAAFTIRQNSGATKIEGENFKYESNDVFLVKVRGTWPGVGWNAALQAKKLLMTFAPFLTEDDFHGSWNTYISKSAPAQSAISLIKSRVWVQEPQSLLQYVLSLLEQVRLEMFVGNDLRLHLLALHFEDWPVEPSFVLRDFDLELDATNLSIDEKTNFNRLAGYFDFSPADNENALQTGVFRNQAAIDAIGGREISKQAEYPNLYVLSDVENQIKETLKLGSSYLEIVETRASPRLLLKDIGDFVRANIRIDSTSFINVPMMIRETAIDSEKRIPLKLWSFQLVPFGNPGGWNPAFSGVVGGDTATITKE